MTIHFETLGSGQPLILIHGLFGTLDNLKSLAKKLSDTYQVFLIDAPGHGKSSTPAPLDLPHMADAVFQFITEQGLQNIRLIGHSLGGKIAMEVALQHPAVVKQLVVADIAPVTYPRRHEAIIAGLQSVTPQHNRATADQQLAQFIEEKSIRGFLLKSFINQNERLWAFDLPALADNYDHLIAGNSQKQSDVDTLFIVGGKSNYVTPAHREEILSRFPNTQSKVIHGAGHWLHAEKPTAFEKICRDFFLDK